MVELAPARDHLLRQSFAGDVLNTLWYARAALDQDWSTEFVSAVGTDPTSQGMITFIEQAGIGCDLVCRLPDKRPGLYLIHLDGAERSFSYWRETSAARLLADDRSHLKNALESATVIYLSGITLAILPEDNATFLLERLKAEVAAGKIIVFDPNIRPALWQSASLMRDMIELAAGQSTIVMPSYDDEHSAFGDASPHATLDRYSKKGAGIVVLKNGPGDVMIRASGQTQSLPTQIVEQPVDTTGAGDAFNGAFIAEYVSSKDIEGAVVAGQKCSAKVICHRGALIKD